MIFKGVNKQTVEFKITNYQFSEITNCKYDSNWLLVDVKVENDYENCQTVAPSLLVQELREITEWFEKLLNNIKITPDSLQFIEPNLKFKLIKEEPCLKTVRLIFDTSSIPQRINKELEYYVDCEMNPRELKKVVEELKNVLLAFPVRTMS